MIYKIILINNKRRKYYYIVNEEFKLINNKFIQFTQLRIFKTFRDILLFINIKGELLTKEQKINLFLNSEFVEQKIKNKIKLYFNL